MADDCVFCKIVRGDLPSFKVYEDDKTIAFLDIRPVSAGHTLVIPKNHATNIYDIPQDDWAAVAETVRILASKIDAALETDGMNIAMNNREGAGQTVHHPHVHIIPRYHGDGIRLMPQRGYKEGEAEDVQKKILASFS